MNLHNNSMSSSFHKVRVHQPSPPSQVTLPRRPNVSSRSKKRIYIDQSRKQIDQYMLKHIKKHKKSIKHLIKEVDSLTNEVNQLKKNPKCESDYQLNIIVPQKEKKSRRKSKQVVENQVFTPYRKGSSTFSQRTPSLRSSRKSSNSNQSSRPLKRVALSQGKSGAVSRQALKKKVEDLRSRVELQLAQKQRIEEKVRLNVNAGPQAQARKFESPQAKRPSRDDYDQDYSELMRLLATHRKSSQHLESARKNNPAEDSTSIKAFEMKMHDRSLAVDSDALQRYKLQQDNQLRIKSDPPTPMSAVTYSESNLLSDDYHFSSKKQTSKVLAISPCLQVRFQGENEQQGSQSDGLFHLPQQPAKFSQQQLSFEVQDSDRRRLKELQFEFDQLVRQQLLASDVREKEMIGMTIRTLMGQISELREDLGRQSRQTETK